MSDDIQGEKRATNDKAEQALKEIVSHLEHLGYEVTFDEDVGLYVADHDNRYVIVIKPYQALALHRIWFAISEYGRENISELLSYINDLNKNAIVSRYIVLQQGVLVESSYLYPYEKKRYGEFIDAFYRDVYQALDATNDNAVRFLFGSEQEDTTGESG